MAALVRQHPQAHGDRPGHRSVRDPQGQRRTCEWDEQPAGSDTCGSHPRALQQMAEGSTRVALEAVVGHGPAHLRLPNRQGWESGMACGLRAAADLISHVHPLCSRLSSGCRHGMLAQCTCSLTQRHTD